MSATLCIAWIDWHITCTSTSDKFAQDSLMGDISDSSSSGSGSGSGSGSDSDSDDDIQLPHKPGKPHTLTLLLFG